MTLKLKKYAVVGHPIQHSKSPVIHHHFASEFSIDLIYERIDISPDNFSNEILALKKKGYLGLNITLPFKVDAFNICDKKSNKSQLTGSVNTISFINDNIIGDSTDGVGLVRDLQAKKIKLSNSRILLIGAGGAANGVMYDLIANNPNTIHILNRTLKKAQLMEERWQDLAHQHDVNLDIVERKVSNIETYDLVINATSSALIDGSLPIPEEYFNTNTIYYDMTYGVETPFLKAAKETGAKFYDGLGMLVEQAAESFFIWHQLKPNTEIILRQL